MALGATPRTIARSVVRQAMRPIALGLALGLMAAVAAGSAMRAMLFEVTPVDPVTLMSVTAVLLTAGLLACYLPSRRAMRVDPLAALRAE
jgi:ABC-type lipoprotein release transport system permease subunit